jgi:tRNA (Thr-GGU) A37 N-methylase
VGVFAQRNKDRPNRLLLTTVTIDTIDTRSFTVRGLDGIDGTPVLDIKPVFSWSGPRGELRVAPWNDALGQDYF